MGEQPQETEWQSEQNHRSLGCQLSPCPLPRGGGQHHHLPDSLLLPPNPVDPPSLCKSQEPGGPGIAGKGYANTSKKFLRTGEGGQWRVCREGVGPKARGCKSSL